MWHGREIFINRLPCPRKGPIKAVVVQEYRPAVDEAREDNLEAVSGRLIEIDIKRQEREAAIRHLVKARRNPPWIESDETKRCEALHDLVTISCKVFPDKCLLLSCAVGLTLVRSCKGR